MEKINNENTLETYKQRIKWLKKHIPDFAKILVSSPDKVIDFIEKSSISMSTKKLTYIVVNKLYKLHKNDDSNSPFDNMINKYAHLISFKRRENTVDEKRKDTWTDWPTILGVFDMIDDSKSFNDSMDKVIIGLYTLGEYIPRLDFVDVFYTKTAPKDTTKNYIFDKAGRYWIYLNNYKTADKYGSISYELTNNKLKQALNNWFLKWNIAKKYLLPYKNDMNRSISVDGLSKRIRAIFKRYINKPVSNQILREIYESNVINSDKYSHMNLNEKYAQHSRLMHSFATAQEYNKNK